MSSEKEDFYNLVFTCDVDSLFNIFGLRIFNFAKFDRYVSVPYIMNFFARKKIVESEEFLQELVSILHKVEKIDVSLVKWILSTAEQKTLKVYYSIFSQISLYIGSRFDSNLLMCADIILKGAKEEILLNLSPSELYRFHIRYCDIK